MQQVIIIIIIIISSSSAAPAGETPNVTVFSNETFCGGATERSIETKSNAPRTTTNLPVYNAVKDVRVMLDEPVSGDGNQRH